MREWLAITLLTFSPQETVDGQGSMCASQKLLLLGREGAKSYCWASGRPCWFPICRPALNVISNQYTVLMLHHFSQTSGPVEQEVW